MFAARVAAAILLGVVSFAAIVGNWELAWTSRPGEAHRSVVPWVGGVSGAIAVAVAPWRFTGWWAVPLLLDLGSIPLLVGQIRGVLRRRGGGGK